MTSSFMRQKDFFCFWFFQSSLKADDTESRYSRQYEARLDPFNSFSRKEKQRKYMNLSPFDKATLNVVRLN